MKRYYLQQVDSSFYRMKVLYVMEPLYYTLLDETTVTLMHEKKELRKSIKFKIK